MLFNSEGGHHMSFHSEVETLLLDAAASHHVQVTPQEIRSALADGQAGTQLAQWAASNLGAENLLTVDELALYNYLDKSGQVDRLAERHRLSQVCALREQDVVAAVHQVRASAEVAKKQTETLRRQHEIFSRFVARRADQQAKRCQLEAAWQRRSESERLQITSEITEIAHSLEFRISRLKQDIDPKATPLHKSLDQTLQSDNALLANLQKLGCELSLPDPEEAKSTDKLRETCLRLIKVTVEIIRTRLDTTYLSVLAAAHYSRDADADIDADEVEALQAEVESLYSEILPVAQIAVEKQHLEPALESISTRNRQSLRKTASSLEYIDQCLDNLLSRATTLQSHAQRHHDHSIAVNKVVARAREEVASPVPDPASTTDLLFSPTKPALRGVRESPALDKLMRSLDLTPVEACSDDVTCSRVAALASLVSERRREEVRAAKSEQDGFEALATETLDGAKRAVQLLRDSVLAETPFGDACLVDRGMEQSIQVLGQEVEKAEGELERVRGVGAGWASLKREEFVRRWAR